ncbi:MAG: esterase family protein [Treponema sp.]|jgi:S-formylglutathione hydrolase FrmB|nr:esterase family protein [Treponema sp.]
MILRGDVSSDVLHMHTGIDVLVPDNYREAESFKIVYLLHGLHGDQGTWIDNTMLPVFADKYNAVFIMPSVGRSFYTDVKYGQEYFTYVSEELPEITKKVFNISGKREDTAVMGCSMGGYGALKCALSKPEQYGFCGAISSACLYVAENMAGLRKDTTPWLTYGGPEAAVLLHDFYCIFGDDLVSGPEHEITELAKKTIAGKVKPKIYAVCGTEDSLRKDNLRFKGEMEKLDIDYTYEEWAGKHDWYFFNDALKKAIQIWYS